MILGILEDYFWSFFLSSNMDMSRPLKALPSMSGSGIFM